MENRHELTHINTRARAHAHTHAHTHPQHVRMHACIHGQAHTHTHTPNSIDFLAKFLNTIFSVAIRIYKEIAYLTYMNENVISIFSPNQHL